MIQQVSSAEPLDKVSYFRRGDGLADIRVRKNITQVEHPADGEQAAWTEWTADEAYSVRDLTEQEAVEQADQIWDDVERASKPTEERLGELAKSSLDNAEAVAELYTLLQGGDAK